jgi:hypothetical protein
MCKSPNEFNGIQNQNLNLKILYSVDRLTQSVIFEDLLESNQILLPKDNLFLMTCSPSVQIYKNY